MSFRGSNYEPGLVPESGSLAGPGSYVGVNEDGDFILTSSAGGGGGDADPAGADNQIQFNNGGSFGASANLTFDDTNLAASRAIFGTTAATLTVAAGELSTLSSIDSGSNKYTTQYDAVGKLQGHVISLGGSTVTAGKLYYLESNGAFIEAQADDDDTGGEQLLAIALNTNSTTHGMLRRGTVRVTGSLFDFAGLGDEGAATVGMPVYVSKGTAGHYQFSAPSGSGEFVRRVGYCVDKNGAAGSDFDIFLLFEPSDTFVEIA